MIVTRERHAFEGQSLTVISSIRRRGVLLVLAVLPDGSRSLIPAAWTNWIDDRTGIDPPPPDDPPASDTLGSLADLLQVRTIVDGLLRRLAESATQKESCHAVELGVPRPIDTTTINRSDAKQLPKSRARSMGDVGAAGSKASPRHSRTAHRPHAGRRTKNGGQP